MILLGTTTFSDMFKKSFLENFGQNMSAEGFILALLMALLAGLGIFFIYKRCYIGVVYDHSFNVSLVIMTILVAVIIVTISSNITLSLGMVGALSIVRYRTAVKSPMDLMFMFWAITSGIAVGAGYYYIVWIAFVFVAATFLILKGAGGDTTTYMLIVNMNDKEDTQNKVKEALKPYKSKLRSKIIRNGNAELVMEIRLKKSSDDVAAFVGRMDGVADVTLVQYRGSYDA